MWFAETIEESKYHIVLDNFFTNLLLLRHFLSKNTYATGTIRANRLVNAPIKYMKEFQKKLRGPCDVAVDTKK